MDARRILACTIWMVALLFVADAWVLHVAAQEPQPAIRVLESDHDFGNVQVGQGAYWTLRISNEGESDLSLGYSVTSEDGSFGWDPERLPPTSPTVSPGDTLELFLLFAPTSPGPHEGTLIIQSNDPDTPELEVTLTGRGVQPQIALSDSTHDLGDVLVGQASEYWMLRISNTGEGDLSILKLQITPEVFLFDANRLPSEEALTIAPGGALELFLFFAPTSSGLQEGKVTVRSNDPDEPELEVQLTGRGVAPNMVLSESAHDFGNVLVGKGADWTLRISNDGDGDLSFGYSVTSEDGSFGFDPDRTPPESPTLSPGETLDLFLRFAPTSSGDHEGTLTLQSNDPDTPELVVTLTGRGVQPQIGLSESVHDFGDVPVGQVQYWTLRIGNEGDGDLLLALTMTPDDVGFGWDASQLPEDWQTVSPGGTLELVLGFVPSDTTAQTATLVIESNDPNTPELEVTLTGRGVQRNIVLSESAHNFGDVRVGQGADWTLRVSNEGGGDLSIVSYQIVPEEAEFFFDEERLPTEWTIAPGGALELPLFFAPTSSGPQEGTLVIESNDPDSPELVVQLTGRGVQSRIALSDSTHDFGDVQVGQGAYWTLRIGNEGQADLSILASVTSEDGGFGWDPTRPFPTDWIVSPGDTMELFLYFAPAVLGPQEGTVSIETNDPDDPKVVVNIVGTGVEVPQPDVRVSESHHDFGNVEVGQVAYWTLRIANEGESDLLLSPAVTPRGAGFGWDEAQLPPDWQTVSSGESLELVLVFVPSDTTLQTGTLIIQSNDPDEPELEVTLAGRGVQPQIALSELDHDFGSVQLGEAAYWTLRISNQGEADLHISKLAVEGAGFGWAELPTNWEVVSPGDVLELALGFAPSDTMTGLQAGTVIIESNDPESPKLEVQLRGYRAEPPQPQIVVEQESHDFGIVQVGQTADWMLRITNGGEADLSIWNPRLTPEEAEFFFDSTRLPTKWTIALGEAIELFLLFVPTSPGRQEGTVIFQSNDPDRPEVQIVLSGNGPHIALGASEYDFGEVGIGRPAQWNLAIRNEGTAPLSVQEVRLREGKDFSLETLALPQTIEPDGTLNVTVVFTPSSMGETYHDMLVVTSDDPNAPELEVRLSGTGTEVQGPHIALGVSEYDFGEVDIGRSDQWELVIRNDGDVPLSVESVRLRTGEDFSLKPLSLPQTIEPDGTLKVTVVFRPSSAGELRDVLVVTSDDPDDGESEVGLIGTGMDRMPPEILFDPSYLSPEVGSSLEMSARFIDNVGIKEAFVLYGDLGEAALDSVEMTSTGGGYFVGHIPAEAVTSRGLVYGFRVSDGTYVLTSALRVMQVGVPRMDRPDVTRAEAYQMISIPLTLDSDSVEQVLEPILGTYDETQWRLFRYQAGGYVEYGAEIEPFAPGRAFWLITRESVGLYAGSGRSVMPNPDGDFKITLQPGWNMIGVPFNFPVAWSQVDVEGENVEPPVDYDGTTFRYDQAILKPWHGYAVKNLEQTAVDIRIPPLRAEGIPASKAALPGEWTMHINVRCGRFEDVENTVGWLPNAQEEWDAHERSEAPPIGAFIALYFDHSNWGRYPGRYTTDFRPVGQRDYIWNFVVETNVPSEEVTLRWRKPLLRGRKGYLIDVVRHVRVDLGEEEEYRFFSEASGAHRPFRLIVGTSEFAARESAGALERPDAFRLAQNVPNPFNARTLIRFEVPDASSDAVELAVFDLLGRKVRTLVSGPLEAGSYELVWDGTDEMGREVSSGVYVARLKGKGFVGVRKMVLIQ